jgi:hypothetical protein
MALFCRSRFGLFQLVSAYSLSQNTIESAETSQLFHQPNHHYNMSSFTAWFFSIVTLNLRSQSGKPPSGIRMAPQQRLLAGTLQERPSRSARGPHQGAHRGRSRGVVHGHIRALRGTGVLSPPRSSVSGASVAARARSVLAPARPAAPGVGDGLQYNAYHVLGSLLQTSLDVSIRLSFLSRQQWARAGRALGR